MHPDYRLILAANRDEFYNRPTARSGCIAAITNYREPAAHMQNAPSRGILIRDFLTGNASPEQYLKAVSKMSRAYNGFNLIAGDPSGLYYYSNRATRIRQLQPGLYGISNHLLDTSWPKLKKGKMRLQGQLNGKEKIDLEKIFEILSDNSMPPDDELPDTGVGLHWERTLSPLFISSPDYGTRSSSVVLLDKSGRAIIRERTFSNTGNEIKEGETRKFSFKINS
jgi:uncharacterized protein with NRDE domain